MKRAFSRFVVAAGLAGLGWVAGTAQVSEPDFELIVDAYR